MNRNLISSSKKRLTRNLFQNILAGIQVCSNKKNSQPHSDTSFFSFFFFNYSDNTHFRSFSIRLDHHLQNVHVVIITSFKIHNDNTNTNNIREYPLNNWVYITLLYVVFKLISLVCCLTHDHSIILIHQFYFIFCFTIYAKWTTSSQDLWIDIDIGYWSKASEFILNFHWSKIKRFFYTSMLGYCWWCNST